MTAPDAAPDPAREALRRRLARRRTIGAFRAYREIRDGVAVSDRRYIERPAR